MWLPGALLLLSLAGCFSIQGPKHVQGREQGSLTVQCHYSPQWTNYQKWWCRGRYWRTCHILVQTRGSEQEEKQGRVSIVDDQRDHSFTVTMEKLQRDDMDTYWCGIKKSGTDLGTRVRVTVYPGKDFLRTDATSSEPVAWPTAHNLEMSSGSHKRTHYVLLVFLKVPILLVLVSVILWLKGSQRTPQEQ
ncbi:CMRF35-like molecule 7 [Ictidomys tridecemlineatus]|uniref:CMRF35-like molecule 7 n=1 Tax=Ictidomys tridecemlineatus TaxID=43179 RepID=UPI000B547C8E|nr:CMRF35-like molecule 7 [Ictidomys tridecemlineatus]KAG3268553.1 CMRF35-like molecule 7 [Ictidomys tridecemlineatus]